MLGIIRSNITDEQYSLDYSAQQIVVTEPYDIILPSNVGNLDVNTFFIAEKGTYEFTIKLLNSNKTVKYKVDANEITSNKTFGSEYEIVEAFSTKEDGSIKYLGIVGLKDKKIMKYVTFDKLYDMSPSGYERNIEMINSSEYKLFTTLDTDYSDIYSVVRDLTMQTQGRAKYLCIFEKDNKLCAAFANRYYL